jgi:Baseplate J-like protein
MIYSCCNENRKAGVLKNPTLNGIDYIEVLDVEAILLGLTRQQTLVIYCLKAVTQTLTTDNVFITGSESITGINAAWISLASAPPSTLPAAAQTYFKHLPNPTSVIVVGANKVGDFSPYTLSLVNDASTAPQDTFDLTAALTGFDPQLTQVQFSFKVECGPDFDCQPPATDCPPTLPTPPPINYLAKDYGSFRSIMLDRINQLVPSWGATSEADLGILLAELVSYVGDRFSYQQDAIATEAYLQTARSRISLRRHALLVDYHVHDGCNARAWIQVQISGIAGAGIFLDRTLTRFYTYAPGMPNALAIGANTEEAALLSGVQVFEPLYDAVLYPENARMSFYTWGEGNCCLPQGATEATLLGTFANLQAGDVLIFQEMKGPQTGNTADADIRHRCAVRLTAVVTQDGTGNPLVDPLFEAGTGKPITSSTQLPTPVTEIQWAQDDALLAPVCISSTYLNENADQQTVTDVSVAFGNVILVDQGLSFTNRSIGQVPAPSIYYPNTADRCTPTSPTPVPARFRPPVPDSPLTQAIPITVVALPGAGNPITAGEQLFTAAGLAALPNSSGYTCLTLQTTNPVAWPTLFGILVKPNSGDPSHIDLSVVYNPPGGAAGLYQQVPVEVFTNLSLNSTDANYAVNQVNAASKFVSLAAPTTAPVPAGFPASPTMLLATGSINLQDTSATPVTYLTAQPASPLAWPPLFGVIAKPNLNPVYFDLQIVYNPATAIGISLLPIVLEKFLNLSPATAALAVDADSSLVIVDSFAQTVDLTLSASDLMDVDPGDAIPSITLSGTLNGVTQLWKPQQNLLSNGPSDPVFVVEVESTGIATLRFGDNTNGKIPDTNTAFTANYRIGNGSSGNVGADSVVYIASADARIQGCRNPLPASGGTDPETADQIRRRAPQAFLTQQRAVTMDDYQTVAESNTAVRQAVASMRWTGSWYTVFIAAEPQSSSQSSGQIGGQLTTVQQKSVQHTVEGFRLAGQDLQLDSPQYVSLQIALEVCVDPNYFERDVEQALSQVLGSQTLPNGQPGFFSPANFTFGQSVYLSPIYAAARTVPGVVAVTATAFQIQGVNDTTYLASGEIPLGPLQMARLENNPSYPDHGQLTLVMEGGK